MVITLTGATGFIGKRLMQIWPPDQHSLVVLGRTKPRLPKLIQAGAWDPIAEEPKSEFLYRSEAIVHLAGEPVSQHWNEEVKRKIRDSRVVGTRNLVSAIGRLQKKPRVLVCASAIGIYGDQSDRVLDELAEQGTGFLPDVCRDWELEADGARKFGVRVVKVRMGVVLGKDGGALAKMLPLFRWGVGGPLGSGRQWMSWIHLEDIARMFQFAVENPRVAGVLNGVAPNPVTNADFTRALGKAVHRPALLPAPRFGVKLLYGEMADILFQSQRCVPRAAEKAGFRFQYPVLEGALAAVVK